MIDTSPAGYVAYSRFVVANSYSDSHAGIPKGLKLVRGETMVKGFEHVTS